MLLFLRILRRTTLGVADEGRKGGEGWSQSESSEQGVESTGAALAEEAALPWLWAHGGYGSHAVGAVGGDDTGVLRRVELLTGQGHGRVGRSLSCSAVGGRETRGKGGGIRHGILREVNWGVIVPVNGMSIFTHFSQTVKVFF